MYGLYNGVVTMFDRETDSVWLQVNGKAAKGALVGSRLKSEPLLNTTWKQWKRLYPNTLVMSPDTPYRRYYPPKANLVPRGAKQLPQMFLQTFTMKDTRMPIHAMLLGVYLQPDETTKPEKATAPVPARAYPLPDLEVGGGVINDVLETKPIVALYHAASDTVAAFSRELDGKTLTFETRKEFDGSLSFHDKETGSRWDLEGRCDFGDFKGKRLKRIDHHMTQWYGWVTYFPQTSIYGKTDPPRTELLPRPTPPPDKP